MQNEKLIRLRKLHGIPERKARTVSMAIEIVGMALLFLGVWQFMKAAVTPEEIAGSVVNCLLGGGLMALGQPVYHLVIDRQRCRIAPDVLRLAEELLE